MILYLDTSALVKVYVMEQASKAVQAAIKQYEVIATHGIAFIEAQAAFSRLKREKKITEHVFDDIKQCFTQDWENYLRVENSKSLMQHAVDLADAFALRAYDSMHLAAAALLAKQSQQATVFACFDNKLNKAAKVLGLELPKW